MTTLPKGTTVDTTKLQREELINLDYTFYNMTYIFDFTSILTVFFQI